MGAIICEKCDKALKGNKKRCCTIDYRAQMDRKKAEKRQALQQIGAKYEDNNLGKMFQQIRKQMHRLQGAGYHCALLGFRQGQKKCTTRFDVFDDESLRKAFYKEENGRLVPNECQQAILKTFCQQAGLQSKRICNLVGFGDIMCQRCQQQTAAAASSGPLDDYSASADAANIYQLGDDYSAYSSATVTYPAPVLSYPPASVASPPAAPSTPAASKPASSTHLVTLGANHQTLATAYSSTYAANHLATPSTSAAIQPTPRPTKAVKRPLSPSVAHPLTIFVDCPPSTPLPVSAASSCAPSSARAPTVVTVHTAGPSVKRPWTVSFVRD